MMGCDTSELEKLYESLENLEKEKNKLFESIAKDLTARLLRKVIKRTPVGNYSKNLFIDTKNKKIRYASFKAKTGKRVTFQVKNVKKGGTLRRGWTDSEKVGDFLCRLKINHFDDTYAIEIRNDTPYASYVEFGHRVRGGGAVAPRYMLSISEDEIRIESPSIIEKRVANWLSEVF